MHISVRLLSKRVSLFYIVSGTLFTPYVLYLLLQASIWHGTYGKEFFFLSISLSECSCCCINTYIVLYCIHSTFQVGGEDREIDFNSDLNGQKTPFLYHYFTEKFFILLHFLSNGSLRKKSLKMSYIFHGEWYLFSVLFHRNRYLIWLL